MTINELMQAVHDKVGEVPCMFGNQNLMEVSKGTKKRPAFIKIAVTDEIAEKFLKISRSEAIALFVPLPADVVLEILQNEKEGAPHGRHAAQSSPA